MKTFCFLAAALAFFPACDDDEPREQPVASRFEAVQAKKTTPNTAAFCDVQKAAADAPTLAIPPLSTESVAPPRAGVWRWINVWATWCHPCIEEMPRLVAWKEKLSREGTPFELGFLSVDAAAADLERFRATHRDAPATMRLATADGASQFFASIGLDAAAPIPIHVFVDPQSRVRCVRAGAVSERDLPAIQAIFSEGN